MMVCLFISSIKLTTYDDPYNICREISRAQNDLRRATFLNLLARCDLEVLHHSGSGQTSKLVAENAKPQEQLMQQYRRNEPIYEQGNSLYLNPQVRNVRTAGMVSILKTKTVKDQRKRPAQTLDFAKPETLPKKYKNETKVVPAETIPTDSYRLADNKEGNRNADKESEEPCQSMSIGGEKEINTRHTTLIKPCKPQTNKRPINRKFVDIRIFFINLINCMEQTNHEKSIKFVTELKECFEVNFYTEQDPTIQVFGRTLAYSNGIPYEYKMKKTQFHGDYYVPRSAIASNYEPKKFEPAAVELLIFENTHKSPEENLTFYINWIEYHCFDKHIDSQELVPKIAVYPVIMLVPEFFYYLKHKMNYLKSADPNVISSLMLDKELNTIDKILKMDFRRLRTELKDEDFNLIIAFRTHVLSYLQVYYVFKRAYHLYVLCFEQIRIEKLCAVKHIQAFYMCICFTHDFEAIDVCLERKLRNYEESKGKDEEKQKDIRKYLEDSFIRRKNTITIALFSYIDAQDRYMKLMFDFDNKSHIMIPAEGFVLVLAMDSKKSKIEKVIQISVQNMTYALRKEALNSISNNTN